MSNTKKIAIITGASSGMGREYVRLADASQKYDELWVIARRKERLEELQSACTTPVRVWAYDLSQGAVFEALQSALETEQPNVGLLINAAGLGKFGTCYDVSAAEVSAMVDINCRALVQMTQLCLPYMSRGGRILQFASSAGFQPLPGLNVYAATKAFVISYTRALRLELTGKGIYVTAVCPIWIKTEFIQTARETKNGQTVRHPFPVLNPRRVARWSLLVNKVGYPVATCNIVPLAMRLASKVVPAPLIMGIWQLLRRI